MLTGECTLLHLLVWRYDRLLAQMESKCVEFQGNLLVQLWKPMFPSCWDAVLRMVLVDIGTCPLPSSPPSVTQWLISVSGCDGYKYGRSPCDLSCLLLVGKTNGGQDEEAGDAWFCSISSMICLLGTPDVGL